MTSSLPVRRRRGMVVVVALVLLGLLGTSVATGLFAGGGSTGGEDRGSPGSPGSSSPTATVPPLPAGRSDVVWREVAGVSLPFSPSNGPRLTTGGRAGGYTRTQQGAALAAVQVLARTSASAGSDVFDPVLATQLVGGDLAAMKSVIAQQYAQARTAAGTSAPAPGAPLPGADARVAGYVMSAYDQQTGTAIVNVLLSSTELLAEGRSIAVPVSLVWNQDDWRVVAPPEGNWGSQAAALDAAPADLRDFAALPASS